MKTLRGVTVMSALVLLIGNSAARSSERASSTDQIGPPLQLPLEASRTEPEWRTRPTSEEFARDFPPLAWMLQVDGKVSMSCTVEIDGSVDKCHILDEAPIGLGFGAAALRMATQFALKPAALDGRPILAEVTIPLRFHHETQDAVDPAEPPLKPATPAALAIATRLVELEGYRARYQAGTQQWMDGLNGQIVLAGDPTATQPLIDALRQASQDALEKAIQYRVHDEAAALSEADLSAAVTFLQSPAGQAWEAAANHDDPVERTWLQRQTAVLAKAHFCAAGKCKDVARAVQAAH